MSHIFISYARTDFKHASKIVEALADNSLDTWIDWKSIGKGEEWEPAIYRGVEEADAFLFLVSADSVASPMCNKEIAHAWQNGKRILPIFIADVENEDVGDVLENFLHQDQKETISKLNFIFCRPSKDEFMSAIEAARHAVHIDYEWLQYQTRLQVKALDWQRHKDASRLLRGRALSEAQARLLGNTTQEPGPTDLQKQYMLQSQTEETRRRTRSLSISGVVIVALTGLSLFAFFQRADALENSNARGTAQVEAENQRNTAVANEQEAKRQATISRAGELSAQSEVLRESNLQLSLLLGIEAFKRFENRQSKGALLASTNTNPHLAHFFTGHKSNVFAVAYSPDGKVVASGSADNTIILWDVRSGKPLGNPLSGHSDSVRSLAFSPNGRMLASASSDKTVRLWDVASHELIYEIKGYTERVLSVAFSPDGNILASADINMLFLWDIFAGESMGQPMIKHSSPIDTITFSPDGKTLASGSWDTEVILWDVASQQPVGEPIDFVSEVFSVDFSPDGKLLAIGGNVNQIKLWDIASQKEITSLEVPIFNAVNSLAFSPDGSILVVGTTNRLGNTDSFIYLWDVESHKQIDQPLEGHTNQVSSVAFSPDGKHIASGSYDSNVILWDVTAYSIVGREVVERLAGTERIAFGPDGTWIVTANWNGTITFWDVDLYELIGQPIRVASTFPEIALSPDGKVLATYNDSNSTVTLLDTATRQFIGALSSKLPDGKSNLVHSMDFSPDEKTLAAGTANGSILLWDLASRQQIGPPLVNHAESVFAIAFSPDGRILASSSKDKGIIIWDATSLKPIGDPIGLSIGQAVVQSIAFSPDSNTIAVNVDNDIIMLDVIARQPVGLPFRGHVDLVREIAFSPDGKTLVSSSQDSTVILWDVNSHQPIGLPLTGHTGPISNVAYSPNGKHIVSGSHNFYITDPIAVDRPIIVWDVDPKSWIEIGCQRAGRNFTRSEWVQYFPTEEYRRTCSFWPEGIESSIDLSEEIDFFDLTIDSGSSEP